MEEEQAWQRGREGWVRKERMRKERGLELFSFLKMIFSVASDMFWHLIRLNIIFIRLRPGLWFTKG